jgi:hypothetical protein
MRRQKETDVPDSAGDQARVDRRDFVIKALVLGGGAVAATALAPGEALAADGDIVHVGQLATGNSASPVFYGTNASTGPGLQVDSQAQDGVVGVSYAANKSGAYVYNDNAGGYGLWARGGKVGAVGYAYSAAATGVLAENELGGVGLSVVGKTHMQRAGLATTAIGAKYKAVNVSGGSLTTASKFLVTMQGDPGTGVYITFARRYSSGQFRVYFNKACTRAAKLAWMVLD